MTLVLTSLLSVGTGSSALLQESVIYIGGLTMVECAMCALQDTANNVLRYG